MVKNMIDTNIYGLSVLPDPKYTIYLADQSQKLKPRYGRPSLYRGYSPLAQENPMVRYTLSYSGRGPGYCPAGDGIDEIMSGRMDLIRSKIEMTLLQLGWRKEIHQKVLYEITKDEVKADNLLIQMGPLGYYVNRERLSIEGVKFDLERQKRMEEVGYFKDTAILNKELKESLIEYLGETQKSALLTDMEV